MRPKSGIVDLKPQFRGIDVLPELVPLSLGLDPRRWWMATTASTEPKSSCGNVPETSMPRHGVPGPRRPDGDEASPKPEDASLGVFRERQLLKTKMFDTKTICFSLCF